MQMTCDRNAHARARLESHNTDGKLTQFACPFEQPDEFGFRRWFEMLSRKAHANHGPEFRRRCLAFWGGVIFVRIGRSSFMVRRRILSEPMASQLGLRIRLCLSHRCYDFPPALVPEMHARLTIRMMLMRLIVLN